MLGCGALALTLAGCPIYGGRPDALGLEPRVYALVGFNTEYDEFNAAPVPPPLAMDSRIVFASNAGTRGGSFSIEDGRLTIVQAPFSRRRDRVPPPPEITAQRTGASPGFPQSTHNLRGPSPFIPTAIAPRPYEKTFSHYENITLMLDVEREPLRWEEAEGDRTGGTWLFDSDEGGRRNLYFVTGDGTPRPFFGNLPQADDAYAAYDFERHELYFSSNRSGRFRIYRYRNTSQDTGFADWLGDGSLAGLIEPATEFDAGGDSMAPWVDGDDLVFASNRPGGAGGFDLYISRFVGGRWDPPRNLQELMPPGVAVNTPANEFRPSLLLFSLKDFQEFRLLLFSSDRPGGKGGYDLYLTALPEFPGDDP